MSSVAFISMYGLQTLITDIKCQIAALERLYLHLMILNPLYYYRVDSWYTKMVCNMIIALQSSRNARISTVGAELKAFGTAGSNKMWYERHPFLMRTNQKILS